MARTITEIRTEITSAFMNNETIAAAYGFEVGASFDAEFSKVSFEAILFFIVSTVIYTLENIFDFHKEEVDAIIASQKPHRALWYRDKALAYQHGDDLVQDEDYYAVIDETKKVVKYASVIEYQGKVYIKVAKGQLIKEQLSFDEETGLSYYFSQIKDAGVEIIIVNLEADYFRTTIDIYYNPMLLDASGRNLQTSQYVVHDAIKNYVENGIPFNGEFRNVALIDALQSIEGVVIPEFKYAQTISKSDYDLGNQWTTINAKIVPKSGYFKVYEDSDLQLTFIPYSVEA